MESIPLDAEAAVEEGSIPEAVALIELHRHEQGLRTPQLTRDSSIRMNLGLQGCWQGKQG